MNLEEIKNELENLDMNQLDLLIKYIKDKKLIIENDCKPISEEHLAHIFEAFYRVDFDRNKSSGGNGLGLYIVQQILKMYNLDYSFKSILTGMSFEVDFN